MELLLPIHYFECGHPSTHWEWPKIMYPKSWMIEKEHSKHPKFCVPMCPPISERAGLPPSSLYAPWMSNSGLEKIAESHAGG